MDKEKIKTAVREVREITTELVVDGDLDGDQAKQILFEFAQETIRREMIGNAGVG